MIATARKYTLPPAVSRQFEFSRFQHQWIASAYEALIPVAAGRIERTEPQRSNAGIAQRATRATRPSAVGA